MAFTLLHNKKENKKRKKKESVPMNKISRKLYQDRRCCCHERCDRRCSGCLQCRFRFYLRFHFRCCRSVHPRHLRGTAEGISSTVKVTMTFSDSAVTDVVVDTSGETASYGAAAADELREQLMLPVLPRSTVFPAPPSPLTP